MPPRGQWIDPKFALIAAAFIGVILYGSLFPFDFHHNSYAEGPFRALIATWRYRPVKSDLIANVLLYFPLGIFLVKTLRWLPSPGRIVVAALLALTLCVSIELAQFYDRGRDAGMFDVYTNTGGALLGAIAGVVFPRDLRLPLAGTMAWRPFVILLMACWLGSRFYPYLPSLDPHKYRRAIEPLFLAPRLPAPQLPAMDLYRQFVVWLAIALLLEALFGAARARRALLLLVPIVLAARIVIAGIVLSAAEVAGGVLAALIWFAWLSRLEIRAILVTALFIGLVVLQALDPFQFTATPRRFGLIPFLGFLDAPRETMIPVFLEKVFTYGALTWLMVRAGCSLRIAAISGAALVLCLRIAQIYIPGRSAEITDAVMLLLLAALMGAMNEELSIKRALQKKS